LQSRRLRTGWSKLPADLCCGRNDCMILRMAWKCYL
jgi:hypothetical protein